MSKELDALKEIGCITYYEHKENKALGNTYRKNFELIENALKEKEQQDSIFKILKEVIEFGQILPQLESNKDIGLEIVSGVGINLQRNIENKERELLRQWLLKTCFPEEFKAFEIIKTKKVNLEYLKCCNSYKQYKLVCSYWNEITKDDFDLLKKELL